MMKIVKDPVYFPSWTNVSEKMDVGLFDFDLPKNRFTVLILNIIIRKHP